MARRFSVWEKYEFVALIVAIISIILPQISSAETCQYTWTRNLKVGATGADVVKLQQFLNSDADTAVALSGVGSVGKESNTYGPATFKAVVKFQEKYNADILIPNGLKKGTGAVGPSTRAKLNSLCSAATPPSPASSAPTSQVASAASAVTSQTDVLTVSDPGQPESSIAPAGAGVLFLNIDLTAGSKDVVVNEITIERVGLGVDAAFASFGFADEQGLQIGNVVSLNANHRAVFRTPFKIPAGEKRNFQIYANMASDLSSYTAQTPAIQVVSVTASSPVQGTLPLRGAAQTTNNSLVVGGATATVSQFDPTTATTRYINDISIKFSGIRITANSQEDITFSNIIWTQAGSAGNGDIANVVTMINGVSYPTFISPYRNREYVSIFDPGIVIKKGESVDVYVQGDITTTGANRTIEFDINDINDEVSLSGNQYGFGVGLSPSGNTAESGAHSAFITSDGTTDGDTGTPFYSGSIVTIKGAGVTSVSKSP